MPRKDAGYSVGDSGHHATPWKEKKNWARRKYSSPARLICRVRSWDEPWSGDALSSQLCTLVPADWQYKENVSVMNIKRLSSISLPDGSNTHIVVQFLPLDEFSYLYFGKSSVIPTIIPYWGVSLKNTFTLVSFKFLYTSPQTIYSKVLLVQMPSLSLQPFMLLITVNLYQSLVSSTHW